MESWIIKALVLLVLYTMIVITSNAQIASIEPKLDKDAYPFALEKAGISVEEELELRIKRGDLIQPVGYSAYDTYKSYVEKHPSDQSLNKRLKRSLVAALADASDKALTEYFDEGGAFILKYMSSFGAESRNIPVDQYYAVAADLLGEGHYLYESLKSKAYFIEALKLQYIERQKPEGVKEKLLKSIALDPLASYTFNELGLINFAERNYTQACENYEMAIKLNPNWELPKEKLKIAEEALIATENR